MQRRRLPNRRASTTFEVAGLKYTVSRFPDGKIGELFLSNHKNNSGAESLRTVLDGWGKTPTWW
jgi:hypothetical protein